MSYYCPNFGSLREHLYICEAVGPPAHKEVGGDNGNDQIGDHLTYTSPPSTEPSVYQAPPTKRARTTRDAQSPRTEMKPQHSPLPTTLSEEKTLQLSHQHRPKQNKGPDNRNPGLTWVTYPVKSRKPNDSYPEAAVKTTGERTSGTGVDSTSQHTAAPYQTQQQTQGGDGGFPVRNMMAQGNPAGLARQFVGNLPPAGAGHQHQRQIQGTDPVACSNPYINHTAEYTAVYNAYLPSIHNPYAEGAPYIYRQPPQEQELQHLQSLDPNEIASPYAAQIPVSHPPGQYCPNQALTRKAAPY
ncbi:MAG: hypothetical protein Q9199_007912 [Rusavskia elegans]